MLKYNNPRLNGTVVSGTGMDHPVRPHVIIGNTDMGYVRGDLVDANAIEEIRVELDNKIKAEAKTRTSEDKKILDQIDRLMSTLDPETINTLKEVFNFLKDYKDSDSLLKELTSITDEVDAIRKTMVTSASNVIDLKQSIDSNVNTILTSDIDSDTTIRTVGSAVLDLNGHTISNSKDIRNTTTGSVALLSIDRGNLVLKNGTITTKPNDEYAINIRNGATLTIEDGTYVGNITAVQVAEGTLYIKGGDYSMQQLNNNGVQGPYGLLINCIDAAYKNGTAKIYISGGTFHGFDPGNNEAEGANTSFLAKGYKSIEAGTDDKGLTIYKVVSE